jgi:hypothetical protein
VRKLTTFAAPAAIDAPESNIAVAAPPEFGFAFATKGVALPSASNVESKVKSTVSVPAAVVVPPVWPEHVTVVIPGATACGQTA